MNKSKTPLASNKEVPTLTEKQEVIQELNKLIVYIRRNNVNDKILIDLKKYSENIRNMPTLVLEANASAKRMEPVRNR